MGRHDYDREQENRGRLFSVRPRDFLPAAIIGTAIAVYSALPSDMRSESNDAIVSGARSGLDAIVETFTPRENEIRVGPQYGATSIIEENANTFTQFYNEMTEKETLSQLDRIEIYRKNEDLKSMPDVRGMLERDVLDYIERQGVDSANYGLGNE